MNGLLPRTALILTIAAWCLALVIPQLEAPGPGGAEISPPNRLALPDGEDESYRLHLAANTTFLYAAHNKVVALALQNHGAPFEYDLVTYDFEQGHITRHDADLRVLYKDHAGPPRLLAADVVRTGAHAGHVFLLFAHPENDRFVMATQISPDGSEVLTYGMPNPPAELSPHDIRGFVWRHESMDVLYKDGTRRVYFPFHPHCRPKQQVQKIQGAGVLSSKQAFEDLLNDTDSVSKPDSHPSDEPEPEKPAQETQAQPESTSQMRPFRRNCMPTGEAPRCPATQPEDYVHEGEIVWARPGVRRGWDRIVLHPNGTLTYFDSDGTPGLPIPAREGLLTLEWRVFLSAIQATDGNVVPLFSPPLYDVLPGVDPPCGATQMSTSFVVESSDIAQLHATTPQGTREIDFEDKRLNTRLRWVEKVGYGDTYTIDDTHPLGSVSVTHSAHHNEPFARGGDWSSDIAVKFQRGCLYSRIVVINGWSPKNTMMAPLNDDVQVLLDASGEYALMSRDHPDRIDVMTWPQRFERILSGDAWALERAKVAQSLSWSRLWHMWHLFIAPYALIITLLLWPLGLLLAEGMLAIRRRMRKEVRVAWLTTWSGRAFCAATLVIYAVVAAPFLDALLRL